MKIEVKDKVIELKFGLKFLRDLNQHYIKKGLIEENGITSGLQLLYANLIIYDPFSLVTAIKCANYGPGEIKLKESEIEEYIESQDVERLCEDFLEQLNTQPVTKGQARLIKEAIESETKKAEVSDMMI